MTQLLADAAGNIFLVRRTAFPSNQQTIPPLATKHTYNPGTSLTAMVTIEKPPLHLLPHPSHEPRLNSSQSSNKSSDRLFYAHFVPVWCCTCVLLVIGFLFCPVLGLIGCVFACAAKVTGVSHEEIDPRLKRAEDCNRIACHLGIGAIIAGAIIILATVAVLLFLFLSSASILVSGSV